MQADTHECRCPTCGIVCTGRFAGCERVWQTATRNGPRPTPAPAPTPAPTPAPAPPPAAPLGDVRRALDALRAEIEQLRLDGQEAELVADPPPAPAVAALLPRYDELLDLTPPPRRPGRWWRRHRAQHLG